VIAGAAVFIYRYQILQYSAETFMRRALPDYISIERINFDFPNSKVTLGGFRILNAPDFSSKYSVEIGEISCRYRLMGKLFLDGIEIFDPIFTKPLINIERQRDGRVNLVELGKITDPSSKKRAADAGAKNETAPSKPEPSRKTSDAIKLPDTFNIKEGSIIFTDRMPYSRPHVITFYNVNAKLILKLDSSYSSVIDMASTGEGDLDNDKTQKIRWNISLKPAAPKLTMSNRFEVSNINMLVLEPYYDTYSPFKFQSGYVSGTLIFDFDNGNIGSTNEIHMNKVKFSVKEGYENAEFWQTTVQDLTKYFTSFGEIVFDFKIKGDMNNPQFYLGPISKQALTMMAIDKVSAIIQEAAGGPKNPTPETDKTQAYIDLIKEFMKKK
jgi:hypothetical protein